MVPGPCWPEHRRISALATTEEGEEDMAMRTCMMIPSCGHNVGGGIREDMGLMRGGGILIVPRGCDDRGVFSGGYGVVLRAT